MVSVRRAPCSPEPHANRTRIGDRARFRRRGREETTQFRRFGSMSDDVGGRPSFTLLTTLTGTGPPLRSAQKAVPVVATRSEAEFVRMHSTSTGPSLVASITVTAPCPTRPRRETLRQLRLEQRFGQRLAPSHHFTVERISGPNRIDCENLTNGHRLLSRAEVLRSISFVTTALTGELSSGRPLLALRSFASAGGRLRSTRKAARCAMARGFTSIT